MLPSKLAFVDLETTGTSAQYDRIIEVGIVRVEEGRITNTFSTLINPQIFIPPQITTITGIKSQDVKNAPTFREVADEIATLLTDCVFVAHNVRFDYGFLKHEFARLEKRFVKKHFCTVRLSRLLFPQEKHHNLDALITRFQIECLHRHRALDDAKVLVTFFENIKKNFSEEVLTKAIKTAMKQPSLPSHLQKTDLSSLPEAPGVYIFYGENNMPLYIGKSINLKDRVLSHFSSDIQSGREMKISQQIQRIETIPTAGELGALFLESQMIKKHLPLYNKKLRYTRDMNILRSIRDDDGYQTVKLSLLPTLSQDELDDIQSIVGIFRSKRDAKNFLTSLAKEYQLCEKLLGLEKTKTGCFASRLGICKGACMKEEKPLFYNLRFTTAFSKSKLTTWPFTGPIVIEEKNMLNGLTEAYVFHKWCYLGHITQMENADTIAELGNIEFDLDTYKILKRYLKNERSGVKIRTISQKEVLRVFDQTQIPLL